MNDLSQEELESKIAFLERHIEEQDKVILKMENRIDRLEASLELLQSDVRNLQEPPSEAPDLEKPPHY